MRAFIALMLLLFGCRTQAAATFASADECKEAVWNSTASAYVPADLKHKGEHPVDGTNVVLSEMQTPTCGQMLVAKSVATLPDSQAWVYLPVGSKVRKTNDGRMYDDRCGNYIVTLVNASRPSDSVAKKAQDKDEGYETLRSQPTSQVATQTVTINVPTTAVQQAEQPVAYQQQPTNFVVLNLSGGDGYRREHYRSHEHSYDRGGYREQQTPTIVGNCNGTNNCNTTVINTRPRGPRQPPTPPSNPGPVYNPAPGPIVDQTPSNPIPPTTYTQPSGPTPVGNPGYNQPPSGAGNTPPDPPQRDPIYTGPGNGGSYVGPGEPIHACCNLTIDRSGQGGARGSQPRDPVGGGSVAASKQLRVQAPSQPRNQVAPRGGQQVRGNGGRRGGRDRQ